MLNEFRCCFCGNYFLEEDKFFEIRRKYFVCTRCYFHGKDCEPMDLEIMDKRNSCIEEGN